MQTWQVFVDDLNKLGEIEIEVDSCILEGFLRLIDPAPNFNGELGMLNIGFQVTGTRPKQPSPCLIGKEFEVDDEAKQRIIQSMEEITAGGQRYRLIPTPPGYTGDFELPDGSVVRYEQGIPKQILSKPFSGSVSDEAHTVKSDDVPPDKVRSKEDETWRDRPPLL